MQEEGVSLHVCEMYGDRAGVAPHSRCVHMYSMCVCMHTPGFIAQTRYSTPHPPPVSLSKPAGVSHSVSGRKVDTGLSLVPRQSNVF